jgi:hypothetical protein
MGGDGGPPLPAEAAPTAAAGFNQRELFERGFTVVRGAVPLEACRRACSLLDEYLGPPGASVADHVERVQGWPLAKQYAGGSQRCPPPDASPAVKAAFWADAPPYLQSNSYRHDVRHPIRDQCMAGLITQAQVDVQKQALGIRASGAGSLKLLQQFLIRTDYQPPPCESSPCTR